MKKYIVMLVFGMALSSQAALFNMPSVKHVHMATDPIGASTLPPVMTPRKELIISNLDGSRRREERQGTVTTASQYWNPYTLRNEVYVSQSEFKQKTVTVSPRVYYPVVVNDPNFVQPASVTAVVEIPKPQVPFQVRK